MKNKSLFHVIPSHSTVRCAYENARRMASWREAAPHTPQSWLSCYMCPDNYASVSLLQSYLTLIILHRHLDLVDAQLFVTIYIFQEWICLPRKVCIIERVHVKVNQSSFNRNLRFFSMNSELQGNEPGSGGYLFSWYKLYFQ